MRSDEIDNDEIRKELYFQQKEMLKLAASLKDLPSKFEELILQQNSLASAVSSLQQKTESLEENVQNFSSQIEALESAQNATNQTLGTLSESVTNILDEKIPELESKISQSGGGEKPWVLIYEKDSEDPAINRNAPNGLTEFNYKAAIGDVDVLPYNTLRIQYCYGTVMRQMISFDISEFKNMDKHFYPFHTTNDSWLSFHFGYIATLNDSTAPGVCRLAIGRFFRWYFSGTKFLKEEYVTDEKLAYVHIARIEVQ